MLRTPQAEIRSLVRSRYHLRAMTLAEVLIAIFVMALLTLGILSILIQSRRLTEGSIYQQTATTVASGYLEQLRNMDLASLCNYDTNGNAQLTASYTLPTLYPQPDTSTEATSDPIATTPGTPPSPSSITPGTTPSGIVDNLKSFDMTKSYGVANVNAVDTTGGSTNLNSVTAKTTWPAIWPGAQNYPAATTGTTSTSSSNPTPTTTTPGVNDLHMNVWVWITDLSGTAPNATKVYGITLFYTWQYQDGNRVRYAMNSLRAIRSDVPSF